MKVFLLGVGLKGKVALHDLVNTEILSKINVADIDLEGLKQLVKTKGYPKVQCEFLEADNQDSITRLE